MRLHSWLSPKCHVQESALAGLGVFAGQPFTAGELVSIWGGVIYTLEEIMQLGNTFPHFRTHPMEVADGYYIGSTSLTGVDDAERFNHGCSPNIGICGQIIVQARRDIAAGEELLFDYETTDLGTNPFPCRCRSSECRGTVDGTAWKTSEFQKKNDGWLSWFVQEKIQELLQS